MSEARARDGAPRDETPRDSAIDPTADGDLPSPRRLLSFYDRLRSRVRRRLELRGRLGGAAAEALLLVPDVFLLMVRLLLDSRTPARTKSLLGGALLYFIAPVDLWPEGVVGPAGYLEDLVLAAAMLQSALDSRLEALIEEHWSGSASARQALEDIASSSRLLLGDRLSDRLSRVLTRRGIEPS
ncbi:MAG: DUF1232 domain-containing protein [Acidobacteriota bacterium]